MAPKSGFEMILIIFGGKRAGLETNSSGSDLCNMLFIDAHTWFISINFGLVQCYYANPLIESPAVA